MFSCPIGCPDLKIRIINFATFSEGNWRNLGGICLVSVGLLAAVSEQAGRLFVDDVELFGEVIGKRGQTSVCFGILPLATCVI